MRKYQIRTSSPVRSRVRFIVGLVGWLCLAVCASSSGSMISDADWFAMNGINGTYGYVYAITYSKGNLFVGGTFTAAGNILCNRVAKWDGSTWCPLGTGMDSTVKCLACDREGNVYATGQFLYAGGICFTPEVS